MLSFTVGFCVGAFLYGFLGAMIKDLKKGVLNAKTYHRLV